MIYLNSFIFPDADKETDFIWSIKRTCYNTAYPFTVLSKNGFERIDFAPITILYGGNGSGKSTALNVIAEKIKASRDSNFNKSNFFPDYVNLCKADFNAPSSGESKIITSDDVFDYMLNVRNLNEGIDFKKEELFEEYLNAKHSKFRLNSIDDYDELKKVTKARRKTQSMYVKSELQDNVREYSNGESAFKYFTSKIGEDGLFILDEPENSLSPKRQIELAAFIEDSARFFNCQFVLSTHSPFLLALKNAKIYDLDENPVDIKKWTQLEHVRSFYEFFKSHEDEF